MTHWIDFESGRHKRCPVSADMIVEVTFRNGNVCVEKADELYWWLESHLPGAIVKYRVIEAGDSSNE
ncbi:MAG: hypothetical protein ACXAEN_24760 [Candidatus Thorarchaeota archaeon]